MVYPSRPHDPTYRAEEAYGHPAHRGFARAIGAIDVVMTPPDVPPAASSPMLSDMISAMVSPIPARDVYLLENDSVLYLAPRLRAEHPDATIVLLAAADRLVGDGGPDPVPGEHRRASPRLETLNDRHLLQTFLQYYCDGVIAVSEFVADRLRAVMAPTFPIHVVHPYIQPAVHERLRAVEPDLASKTAVTICQWRDHKGLDLLTEAWTIVRRCHPDAELRIVGPGHPAAYANIPGVTVCGFVPDLAAELAGASLYVHPARVEAFGVSVVEAMCAGLPAVVTETTGARVAVRQVDESLIAAPSSGALASAVTRYFAADLERRTALSDRSRAASEPYTAAVQTQRFRREFQLLLEAIAGGRSLPMGPTAGGGPRSSERT